MCAVASLGCGRIDYDAGSSGGRTIATDVAVEPAYPSSPDWNDYVRREDPAAPPWAQPGTPCDGSETGGPSACIHAGELRLARFTMIASCAEVETIFDEGQWLQWTCDDSGGSVVARSTGQSGFGDLARQIVGTDWRPNAVRVVTAEVTYQSLEMPFWTNPIAALPDTPGTIALSEAGTIYVLEATRTIDGVSIEEDRIGLVVRGEDNALRYGGTTPNCSVETGEVAAPNAQCLLTTGRQKFLWIEGQLDGGGAATAVVNLVGIVSSRLHRVRAVSGRERAIHALDVHRSVLSEIVVANSGVYGFHLVQSHDNVVRSVAAFGNGASGGPGAAGVIVDIASRNVLTRVTASSNEPYGVLVYGAATLNTLSHVTAGNNGYTGVAVHGSDQGTVASALVLNHPLADGLHSRGSAGTTFAGAAVAHNRTGVLLEDSPGARVLERVVTGGNIYADCNVVTAGVEALGCPADVAVTTGLDATAALVLRVTADDTANASDAAGAADRASITDWLSFEHPLRHWGADGAFPGQESTSVCTAACRIWDWRIGAGASAIRVRDASGAADTTAVYPATPCPPSVSGDVAVTDARGDTFLVYALEVPGDGLGDDDGLCESNERCARSEYFGADQGDIGVALGGDCNFAPGVVTGVRMTGWKQR